MASDYDRIREENIRGYGEYRHHLAFLGRLYTDRTHFIFELLQNAEDAGATSVWFKLHYEMLEVFHDGRPFNEGDVRGICGVGEGTKAEDLIKIGKFGIGFKSVYAYTARPEISSGDEHFIVEDFVRPIAGASSAIKPPWTTRFLFPFDHKDVTPNEAYHQIKKRLDELSIRTMLFLKHVEEICWEVQGGLQGRLQRIDVDTGEERWVTLSRYRGPQILPGERWLVFKRPVDTPNKEAAIAVEIAFLVSKDLKTGQQVILPVRDADLVVFFPTAKSTRLGFLIQGPYRTTPARDNVPADDPWNALLIAETASLLTDTLGKLRDRELMSVELLEALPTRSADFPPESMFYPLYLGVRDALRSQPLLPTQDGSFVSARDAKLARSVGLVDLFSSNQLRTLFGRKELLHWLTIEISETRTPDLRQYLLGNRSHWNQGVSTSNDLVDDFEVRPEVVARNLTWAFMAAQSDEWVGRLYAFFGGQRDVWNILKGQRFIRLQDQTHVPPFDDSGTPRAYLPSTQPTDLPTVKQEVVENDQARQFLRALGIPEPNSVGEVLQRILPIYAGRETEIADIDEHGRHLSLILSAISSEAAPLAMRTQLLEKLRVTPFVRGVNLVDGKSRLLKPGFLYARTPELEMYFESNPDTWFADEPSLNAEQLSALGVLTSVAVARRFAEQPSQYVVLSESRGRNVRALDGFDPDFSIVGLEHALKNITAKKAAYIWNQILARNHSCLRGVVETSSRQNFAESSQETKHSKAGQMLIANEWIPGRSGKFHKPGDLSLDDLPRDFKQHDRVAAELGMRAAVIDLLAKTHGIPPETLRFVLEHAAEVEELKKRVQQREEEFEAPVENGSGLGFAGALTEAFAKPNVRVAGDEHVQPGPVRNPALRRSRVQEDIADSQAPRSYQEIRFRKVPRRVWDAKENHVRGFLRQEYGGFCQICNSAFIKRDGEPYFEGLYLASRTLDRWLDRPGNVMCLCATCCVKFQFGSVETDEDILHQINHFKGKYEGGTNNPDLKVVLCGEARIIHFTERHMIDLQEMIRADIESTE